MRKLQSKSNAEHKDNENTKEENNASQHLVKEAEHTKEEQRRTAKMRNRELPGRTRQVQQMEADVNVSLLLC